VQESLTNIAKHAHATRVTVLLAYDDPDVVLTLEDDGVGVDPDTLQRPSSHGISGMQQRMAQIGGEFTIERMSGRGTRVRARLRYAAPALSSAA
jgi:two-component system sensor kinase